MNRNFKVLHIEHIAIAVENSKSAKVFFGDLLGMDISKTELVESENVLVSKITGNDKLTNIELIESKDPLSAVKKFINKRGQGIHHIALEVDNIYNAINYLKFKNIKIIYDKPQNGANNKLITFIHPSVFPGVLLELCQKK